MLPQSSNSSIAWTDPLCSTGPPKEEFAEKKKNKIRTWKDINLHDTFLMFDDVQTWAGLLFKAKEQLWFRLKKLP